MASIKISPKHGVNPTIPVCFFCGKEKQELALLGKLKGDVEAPMNMVLDYEPCEHCKRLFEKGVLVIGVSDTAPDGRPPIQKKGKTNLYPTGAYIVATKDFITRVFEDEIAENLLKAGKCLMDYRELETIQKRYEAVCKEAGTKTE